MEKQFGWIQQQGTGGIRKNENRDRKKVRIQVELRRLVR